LNQTLIEKVTSMPNDLPPPITEDDREATVTRLQEAFAEGRISHAEMDAHLQAVLTAKTPGDLAPVLASLPDTNTGRTVTLAGTSGRFRRRGAWRVPRVLKIESEYGKVDLDFSQAIFENPVVDIELQLRFGRAKITLPNDAVVDIDDLKTDWKQPIYKTPQRSEAGGPRIRIFGTMEYGRLKIRHKAH
jgi:Domain of unknown function (DUF1707)